MTTTPARPRRTFSALAMLLVAALFLALGSVGTATAGGPLTPAKVKKIAKKVAAKAITEAAPGLSVKKADTATSATTASTATTATTATKAGDADKLGGQPPSAYLPADGTAADSAELDGATPAQVRTQWLSVTASGDIYDSSRPEAEITVTHPAVGTYCVDLGNAFRASVSGTVQSQVNGFQDLTIIVTSLYNTGACPSTLRIYTANVGALADTPFTLTYSVN